MSTIKFSRQRESIKQYLSDTKEHPSADMVYMHIKNIYPNVSLGTVYRNLNFLVEQGEIIKLSHGDGCDRFDGNTSPHYHFVCTECSHVYDLDIPLDIFSHLNDEAGKGFDGKIEGSNTFFYGKCKNCLKKDI